jgi:hypothetical protein
MVAPVTPAAPAKINAAEVATDIVKYGGLAVALLEVAENTLPSLSVPAGAQAIIAAVVGVATALLALSKQKAVVAAAAAAPQ